MQFAWDDSSSTDIDAEMHQPIKSSAQRIKQSIIAQGLGYEADTVYPSLAHAIQGAEELYGSRKGAHWRRLVRVKRKYDREDVMRLAGGFKIPVQ